ncbi:MAG TPA: hypothetical protein VME22_19180 [Solirubrobacteraceae bacterium]|nr:hypothetical protein [Solirubrobacteraceae bacterium]
MRLELITAVATPELIGVLVWWTVMLGVPVMLIRRWLRRRHSAAGRGGVPGARITNSDVVPVRGPAHSQGVGPVPSASICLGRSTLAPPRLPHGTLDPLCRYVDFRRRLGLAAAELERRLSALSPDQWRVEPYPLTGERRNTVIVLGASGAFVVSATYPPGSWDDVIAVSRLAGKIQLLLPGYAGQVQPAICHPFASVPPRLWYRADDNGTWVGAWLVGGDSLVHWLEHFGREHGLGSGDLERFDALAEPNWLKPAIVAAPSWPPLPDRGPLHPQE